MARIQLHLLCEEFVELLAALPAAAERLEAELVVLAVGRVQLEEGRHLQEGARDHSYHVAAAIGTLECLQRLEQRCVAAQQVLWVRVVGVGAGRRGAAGQVAAAGLQLELPPG
jgi:hypothetical protein